jgi:fructokinase
MTYRVAGIGEILWDRFPDGDRLGGAPANFAFHTGQLGASSRVVSRIGADADGHRLAALLDRQGISREFLQTDPEHATGTVEVTLRQDQPSYEIKAPVAWDFLELTSELKSFAGSLDALCFGTLGQRHAVSRRTIKNILQLCPPTTLRIFDINLRQEFYDREVIEFGLRHATVLKLNGDEQIAIGRLFGWTPAYVIAAILNTYPVRWIAVTKGAEGCEIHTRDDSVQAPAVAVETVDTVGAGDAFSAALALGLLVGRPLEDIAAQANRVGSFVAGKAGAMPPLPLEWRMA